MVMSKSVSAAEDVASEQPRGAALADGLAEALDRQGILGAAVHVTLRRADGVGRDEHAFHDAERVALEHGAVHERAGVALVGVADEVLLAARLVVGDLPLLSGREAGAAAAAQARCDDLVADFGRCHRSQRLGGGAETAGGERRVQARRVDDPAVREHDLGLPGEERRLGHGGYAAIEVIRVVVAAEQKTIVQLPVAERALEELVDGLRAQVAVAETDAIGGDQVDEDLALAVAHAAGLDDRHVQAAPLEVGRHLLDDGERAVGAPAGAGADVQDHPVTAAAGALEARRALLPALVLVMADRTVIHAGDHVGARSRRGVPAARAARGHELAVVHARLDSLWSVAPVARCLPAPPDRAQAAASSLAASTSSRRPSSFSVVR